MQRTMFGEFLNSTYMYSMNFTKETDPKLGQYISPLHIFSIYLLTWSFVWTQCLWNSYDFNFVQTNKPQTNMLHLVDSLKSKWISSIECAKLRWWPFGRWIQMSLKQRQSIHRLLPKIISLDRSWLLITKLKGPEHKATLATHQCWAPSHWRFNLTKHPTQN